MASVRPFRVAVVAMAVAVFLIGAQGASAQWQIESKDGETSIKFGFLAALRAESIDAGDETQDNLFFRRLRILAGGKVSKKITFFFETDSPNLGKAGADGKKNAGDVYIQDFIISYNHSENVHVDVGQLLIENSYNSNQSAASLLTTDYGPYSFIDNGPLDERVGRDYGVRLRGYAADKHLEYRLGVYQGLRGPDASNPFRVTGRLMYNFFEPQVGYFYQGTSFGKKKIFSIGASYDTQDDYQAVGGDLYLDMPVGNGNGFTFQVDLVNFDGGDFIPTFVDQDTLLVEAGYFIKKAKLQPFVGYSERDFAPPALADEERLELGFSIPFKGHNRNLKVSWTTIDAAGRPSVDQLWINFQVFQF